MIEQIIKSSNGDNMTYIVELDVSHEPTHSEVNQFATEYGCTAKLILQNGPAGGNPLYQFSSDNYNYLEELKQVFDRIDYQTMIVED